MTIKETASTKDLLLSDINRLINDFKIKKEKNKSKDFITHLFIKSEGIITAMLLGISLLTSNRLISTIAVVIAIVINLISTISMYFNFHEQWLIFNNTSNRLYGLRDDLNYYLAGKKDFELNIKEIDRFKNRLESILKDTNESWDKLKTNKTIL